MIRRPPRLPGDVVRMLALARAHPPSTVHVIDLPYRLSSWALENPASAALWEDDRGRLLGWAVLQTPFWALDYALHPDAPPDALATVLAWAGAVAAQLPERYACPAWYTPVMEQQTDQRRELAAAGFVDQSAAAEPWAQVIFRRDGQEPAPQVRLRPGFAIRPLRGEAEVPAYVALHRAVFGTRNMTAGWRSAVLRADGYRPAFDLVATDAQGELAGFCIGWWLDGPDGRSLAQIEPFGVRADARRFGLAWALMFELLRRFADAGAAEVRVMTDTYRDAAYVFYQGCGFRIADRVLMYCSPWPA